jgi:rfaE bifunctional protein nucleotidyltransferase chain/domain/rfaE bifunctional protein kinase chain/domain
VTGLVVVGDALLDVDLAGTASRLCPDEPAPVVDIDSESVRPGGAGLAARLAADDGVDVTLVTALADDEDGTRLRVALQDVPVLASRLDTATPVKTRLRSGGRSVARLDRGGPPAGAVPVTEEMLAAVRSADAVLVADYGRGLTGNERLRAVLAETARRTPVVWDPHPRSGPPVPGAWLVTPNLPEARAVAGGGSGDAHVAEATRLAGTLRERWRSRAVVVTLGRQGAVLDHGGVPVAVPAPDVRAADACGAGDRFAVTATCGLMRGTSADEAVHAAVGAAAEFLALGGVAALGRRADPVGRPEDTDLASALAVIARTRASGGVVVATGGCFDLLHTGHLRTLRAARALGDCLVVCLNSDSSVRELKGADRPINHQDDRAELLSSLDCVDAVVLFDTETPEPLLRRLRPDLWVKGGDYSVDALSEADTVRSWGGRTVVVPYHAGRSTTRLAAVLADID